MEDKVQQTEEQEPEVFDVSEVKCLGLDVDMAEPHISEVAKLGQGGSGEVVEAKDEILGRNVAVKVLHSDLRDSPKQIERIIREAQAAAQLEHPNIVPIYALGVSPTKGVYFTMKRLHGDSLRHIITQLALKNPAYTWEYTPSRRLSIFVRICQGISYAHSKDILHRDLKPENIRIGNYGEVTIIDWGLVREIQKHGDKKAGKADGAKSSKNRSNTERSIAENILVDSNPTIDGELSGTPRYMSPEQADALNSELDKRTDIYSLGVILYELLTCFNPFYDKSTEEEIIKAVQHGNYLRPRQYSTAKNLSVELEAICLKALELNKDMRYQTVDDLLRDIYAHQEGRPVQAYKGNVFTGLKKLYQRNPIRSTIFVSALLSIFVFTGVMHVIRESRNNSVIRQVKTSVREIYSLQEKMQNQLAGKSSQAMSMPGIQSIQNNIDTQFDMVNRLLSSIPQTHIMGHHYRERIMLHRLRHDSINKRLPEISKDLAMVDEFFGNDNISYSPELDEAINIAKKTLNGVCSVTNLDTVPSSAEIRIQSMELGADGVWKTGRFLPVQEYAIHEAPSDKTVNPEGGEVILASDVTKANSPLQNFELDKGYYKLHLSTASGISLELPLFLGHAETIDKIVKIPSSIPAGTVYVPEGKYRGGDKSDMVEVPAFFLGKYEVTFAQYFEFWKNITDANERLECIPKLQFSSYENTVNAWDANGQLMAGLKLDKPVVGISQAAASAFCKWYGEHIGRTCRLPSAIEWEKAARGDDQRLYPWGNSFENEFAYTVENKKAADVHGMCAKGGSFPMDCSPYGAMDMAGNVREWTSSGFDDESGLVQIKGASFATSKRFLPLVNSSEVQLVPTDVGFRILLPALEEDFK